jgi:hypothetical protein
VAAGKDRGKGNGKGRHSSNSGNDIIMSGGAAFTGRPAGLRLCASRGATLGDECLHKFRKTPRPIGACRGALQLLAAQRTHDHTQIQRVDPA